MSLPSAQVNMSGVFLDHGLSMEKHVNQLCKSCHFQLGNIRYIRSRLNWNSKNSSSGPCHVKVGLVQQYSVWHFKNKLKTHLFNCAFWTISYVLDIHIQCKAHWLPCIFCMKEKQLLFITYFLITYRLCHFCRSYISFHV